MNLEPLEMYAFLVASFCLSWVLVKLFCNGVVLIASAIYMHKFEQIDDTFQKLVAISFGKPAAFCLMVSGSVTGLLAFIFLSQLRGAM